MTPTPSPKSRQRIPREAYADFIGQIELRDIWLHDASISNNHGPRAPKGARFRFESEVGWETRPQGFRAFDHTHVYIESSEARFAEIEVTFALDFISEIPMTDEIFEVFGEINLPVNTWPYLREFTSATMGRMGWRPFTLPALKSAIQSSPRKNASARSKRNVKST